MQMGGRCNHLSRQDRRRTRLRWGVCRFAVVLVACAGLRVSSAEVHVDLQSVDESAPQRGKLISLTTETAVLRLPNGSQQTISRSDLRSLAPVEPSEPVDNSTTSPADETPHAPQTEAPHSRAGVIWWTNGDWTRGADIGIAAESLRFRLLVDRGRRGDRVDDAPVDDVAVTGSDARPPRGADAVALVSEAPLEFVRGILWDEALHPGPRGDDSVRRDMRRQVRRGETTTDIVWLTNGDRLVGDLRGLDRQVCQMTTAVGATSLPAERLAAIAVNSELALRPERGTRFAFVMLRNGSRLTAREVTLQPTGLAVATETGWEATLSWTAVRQVDFFGERCVPLSAHPPVDVAFTPYLDRAAQWETDGNLHGGPLVLRGENCGWGLGVSSGSRLTWPISGGGRFEATVGVDDAAGGAGSVVFVIRGDERELLRSDRLTGQDAAVTLGPLDLTGISRLTLAVEYSDRGDIQDFADWCRPTLLLAAPTQ